MPDQPQSQEMGQQETGGTHDEVLEPMLQQVGSKELRKLRARQETRQSIWFGLGTFGVVGWSVAVPTVIGVALGIWIDSQWPSRFSWTLMLLIGGLMLGCLNAWYWVSQERGKIGHGEGRKDG
jgi:ATP synthase protein I